MKKEKEIAGKLSNVKNLTEEMSQKIIDNISDKKEKKLAKEIALIWGQEIIKEYDGIIRLLLDQDQLKKGNKADTDQTKVS